MDYRVLGPLEVRDGERSLALGGTKQRALLALLLLSANRVVSRERLIDELWGDDPPETAVTTVQVYVSRLRKVLPADVLVTRSPGYLLRIDPDELDLDRFERLRKSGELREALDAVAWAAASRSSGNRSRGSRAGGSRSYASRRSRSGSRPTSRSAGTRELIGELEALIAEHPHRERLRGQLMLALYRSGRQAEALEAYRQARATLDELGIEPSEELHALEKQILTHDASLTLAKRKTNLPSEPTPLVGRKREVAEVLALLRSNTLVTLTGAGGSGKTRLALAAAGEVLGEFADGVWFVSLASRQRSGAGRADNRAVRRRARRAERLPAWQARCCWCSTTSSSCSPMSPRSSPGSKRGCSRPAAGGSTSAPSRSTQCRRCRSRTRSRCSRSGARRSSRDSRRTSM